jgi:hypothetical protein
MAEPTRKALLEDVEKRSAECQADLSARTRSLELVIAAIEREADEPDPDGSPSAVPEFVAEEDSLVNSVDELTSLAKTGATRR